MRKWLVEKRKKANKTQKEIADKVGITRQMIGALENGTATPHPKTAMRIADVLDFDWEKFFEDDSEQKESRPA